MLLVQEVPKHVADSFSAQQWAVREQDSMHLLKEENWQTNGGAVTEKPGYTPHCLPCAVTLQVACEMGSLVA